MPITAKRTTNKSTVSTAIAVKRSSSSLLSVEDQLAERALDITDQTNKLVASISTISQANLSIEQSIISFRNDVVKTGLNEVHMAFDPIVESAKSNYDIAKKQRATYLSPWERADELLRAGLNQYYSRVTEHKRIEQQLADRQQAENERLAAIQRDQERIKLEKSIEKKIDTLPIDADPRLIEKLLAPLEEFNGPQPVAPPIIVSEPELTGVMHQTDNWKGSVVAGSEMAVLRQIVAGELPISLIEFRTPELNRLAKLHQNKKSINGLRFWNEPFVRGVGGR